MTLLRPVLTACAATVLLACSPTAGGPPPAGEAGEAEVAEVAEEMAGLFTRLSPGSAQAAECFGAALAAERSAGQLRAAGLLDADGTAPDRMPTLPRDDAAAWVDAWFGCVDYVEVAAAAQQKATPRLDVRAFERCLDERLPDATLREAATDGLSGETGSSAVRRLGQTQFTCARRHD